jgi:DNA-binding IclR family transcriptional regulator
VAALAVPVTTPGGRGEAAGGSALPLARYGSDRREELLAELDEAAGAVKQARP